LADGKLELRRQAIHFGLGAFLLIFLLLLGRMKLIYMLSSILFVGFLLISFVMRGYKIPLASWFVERFERREAPLPGYGSAWYVVGFLLCALLIGDVSELAATILVLAIGDAASNIVGSRGKSPLPYNRKKTLEGTLSFALFSLPAFYFIGWSAVPLALIAAVVESLPIGVDDNLSIPIACSLFFLLLP
jgi:dolichol kinase